MNSSKKNNVRYLSKLILVVMLSLLSSCVISATPDNNLLPLTVVKPEEKITFKIKFYPEPKGDYSWFLDDKELDGKGDYFEYTQTADNVISHTLEVRVQQDDGVDSYKWNIIDHKLIGFWTREGYNTLYEFDKNHFTKYEITDISSLKAVGFDKLCVNHFYSDLFQDIILSNDGDKFTTYAIPFENGEQDLKSIFTRIQKLPDVCHNGIGISHDPILNFEVLWKTFKENYPFFKQKKEEEIDYWDEVYEDNRSKVNQNMSDVELFNLFTEMLSPLADGHVNLNAKFVGGEFQAGKEKRYITMLKEEWKSHVENQKLDIEVEEYKEYFEKQNTIIKNTLYNYLKLDPKREERMDKMLIYGMLKNENNIGYLLISGMGTKNDIDGAIGDHVIGNFINNLFNSPDKFQKKLINEMDNLITYLSDNKADALIIDLRFNEGGVSRVRKQIARYFVDKVLKSYTVSVKKENELEEILCFDLKPAEGKNRFTKPIVLLTSDMTASAAELFVLCLSAYPHVEIFGEPTEGVFSSMLQRHLPNGWNFTLSNEVVKVVSEDKELNGKVYERVGIPVKDENLILSFSKSDRDNRKDSCIDAAISYLSDRLYCDQAL